MFREAHKHEKNEGVEGYQNEHFPCTMPLGIENLIQYSLLGTGYNSGLEPILHLSGQWSRGSVDLRYCGRTVAVYRGRAQSSCDSESRECYISLFLNWS